MNCRMDYVYLKLKEFEQAVKMDSFNLTRDSQDRLDMEIGKLKEVLDEVYGSSEN